MLCDNNIVTHNSPVLIASSPSINKNRAKENRLQFRNIITEISNLICDQQCSTNQVLSQAIAHITLSKFTEKFENKCLFPAFNIDEVLIAFNSIGFGITSQGKIVYGSNNLLHFLGIKHCLMGEHISNLITKSNEFMYQVFHCRHRNILTSLITAEKTYPKFWMKGQFCRDEYGNELFLAVAERIEPLTRSIGSPFCVHEILLDESFSFVSNSCTYLDKLLGFDVYHSNVLDYVIEEDLFAIFGNIKQDLYQHGYKDAVMRHHCADSCHLFVRVKFFALETADSSMLLVCYCIPFAFGAADSDLALDIIDSGMRMLSDADTWLAQLPCVSK